MPFKYDVDKSKISIETIKRDVLNKLTGVTIQGVNVNHDDIVKLGFYYNCYSSYTFMRVPISLLNKYSNVIVDKDTICIPSKNLPYYSDCGNIKFIIEFNSKTVDLTTANITLESRPAPKKSFSVFCSIFPEQSSGRYTFPESEIPMIVSRCTDDIGVIGTHDNSSCIIQSINDLTKYPFDKIDEDSWADLGINDETVQSVPKTLKQSSCFDPQYSYTDSMDGWYYCPYEKKMFFLEWADPKNRSPYREILDNSEHPQKKNNIVPYSNSGADLKS